MMGGVFAVSGRQHVRESLMEERSSWRGNALVKSIAKQRVAKAHLECSCIVRNDAGTEGLFDKC